MHDMVGPSTGSAERRSCLGLNQSPLALPRVLEDNLKTRESSKGGSVPSDTAVSQQSALALQGTDEGSKSSMA